VRRTLSLLALVAVLAGGCLHTKPKSAFDISVVASGREPREIYAHGEKMMKAGLYDKAMSDFQELRNFHRDDPLSVRAQLSLAEIRFKKGEFDEARYAYEEFLQYHPRHPDLDFVVYRIGLSIYKRAPKLAGRDQSLSKAAVNRWTGFAQRFPQSTYIAEVEKLSQRGLDRVAGKELFISRFYAKKHAWRAVEGRAADLVARYPTATHADEAMAMLARAYHSDGRPEDALAVRERLVADHPESRWIRSVDQVLRLPPGEAFQDELFPRPYHVAGGGMPAGGGGGGKKPSSDE
jgi:outer membrane protein assembly factor BamD